MSDNPHQQTEWLLERIGKVTASNAWKVLDFTKGSKNTPPQPTAARKKYLMDIVTQRLTGQQTSVYVTPEMQWGIDQEGFARAAYEEHTGTQVELVGFIPHPTIENVGASPDGFVGLDGAVEYKCPTSARHLEFITGNIPEEYFLQMQFQMWCCGTQWTDFCSYDPRVPKHLSLFIRRVPRDAETIALIERGVIAFLAEVDATITKIEECMK